jgi:hypothetical protein
LKHISAGAVSPRQQNLPLVEGRGAAVLFEKVKGHDAPDLNAAKALIDQLT